MKVVDMTSRIILFCSSRQKPYIAGLHLENSPVNKKGMKITYQIGNHEGGGYCLTKYDKKPSELVEVIALGCYFRLLPIAGMVVRAPFVEGLGLPTPEASGKRCGLGQRLACDI